MADPFIGEIRMFGGNFAPVGWAFCEGQLLPIDQNDALFVLIGTIYGGDGQTTFALPDLRGRVPVHRGSGAGLTLTIGQAGGEETVTLTPNQLPAHTHGVAGSAGGGTKTSPAGNFWASEPNAEAAAFTSSAPDAQMGAGAIGNTGGSQPHSNLQPYLCVSFIVALVGIFPSRN
ncbi:MAG: tail fiber protein [Bryobacteraceae bacterium]|nr:tail fiber protein [Bryobacteraceae bacterium]